MADTQGQDILIKIGADLSALKEQMNELGKTVQSGQQKMSASVNGLRSSFMSLAGTLVAAVGFQKVISETIEWEKEAVRLSRTLGITTTEASILNVALGDIGSSAGEFLTAVRMINQHLKLNEAGFRQLGIATRDSSGNFRNQRDIMLDANRVILQYKEGIDRNTISQRIYGRGWQEVQQILNLTAQTMQDAAAKAEEWNLTVGPDRVERVNQFRAAMHEMEDAGKGIGLAISDVLMPVLTELVNSLQGHAKQALLAARVAADIFAAGLIGLKTIFEILGIVAKTYCTLIGTYVAALADVLTKVFNRDWAGAKAAWVNGFNELKNIVVTAGADIVAASSHNRDMLVAIYDDAAKALNLPTIGGGVAPGKGASQGGYAVPKGGDKQAGDEPLSEKGQDLARQTARDIALARLEEVRKGLEQEKTLYDRTALEQVQQLIQIEDQKKAIQERYLEEKYANYRKDKEKMAEYEREKAQISLQNSQAVAQIERQATLETAQRYRQMISGIQGTFTQGLQQMAKGQMSFRQVVRQVGWQIVDDFIAQAVQTVVVHTTAEAAKTAASTAGAATRGAVEEGAAAKSLLISAGTAIKQIMISAWTTAANVYNAISGIPFVGPFLAPVLAIAAVGAVMGFAKNISSAAGGYDIPAGSNPMTQLHANEMVLPATLADRVRNMTDEGKGKRGGSGQAPINVNISAVDGASVKRLLMNNGDAIAAALRRQAKIGR